MCSLLPIPGDGRKNASPYIIIVQIMYSGPSDHLNYLSHFVNRILLKPAIGAWASVAYFITGHKQTQSNRACYFPFFVFLVSTRASF